MTTVYAIVSPVVLVTGLLGVALGLGLVVTRRLVRRRLLAVAVACWVLYLSRLGLMALIEVTSSPALISEYLEPAFLSLWIAAVLSVAAVAPFLRSVTVARRSRPVGRRARRA